MVECWLRVAGGPGFNAQSRTASYQRLYKNGTSIPLFGTQHYKKVNTGSYSRIKIGQNIIDKIWDRNPSKSEVIGRCDREEKTDDHAELTIVER